MSKSLQEQLIAAGLVDKKRAAELDREKRRDKRRASGKKLPKSKRKAAAEPAAQRAQAVQREKAARDRELELKRREKARRKALAAEIRQLVLSHRVDRSDADIAHRFVHHGKVKQIYVDAGQHKDLAAGRLVIVRSAGKYDLVPAAAADKIRERDPAAVIAAASADPGAGEADDDYQGFEVPDDMMW